MKRTNLILMLLTLCVSLFAQPVTVTFTGRDAKNQPVQLNRVVITNLTQNWQETIYYPDTILMMGSTGINDVANADGFKLSQNVPNPFDGTTDFALQMPEAGKVSLTVYDLNSKKITAYQGKLAAGVHTFRVLLNTTQSYLLTARCGSEMATIKMINNGNAGENAIRHLGEGNLNMMLKSGTKGTTSKPFAFGDNMIYMGYAIINGKECVSQTVEKRQLISETITLQFDSYPPTVTTASITEITSHSAMSGGEVLQDGGSAVITKGVCWSVKANPTINDSHIAAGSGLGSFVSALTGLTYGTTYYVRAYAENGMGVSYGNEQSFTTVAITPPVVTTAVVSNITNNSATCGGTIQDMGSQITGRGVCWSTSPNPTVENSCTNDGVGAGTFTSSIKNLDHSTLYYVRAYAITVDGTFYGDEKSFTTQEAKLAMAVTGEVTDITTIGANCSYTVIDMGTYVTARGVCWSTQPNPTVADNHTTDGIGSGTFISQLANLQGATTYYVRAYATNSDGAAYGDDKSFTTLLPCGAATVTDCDGNTYNTVQIGNQCWMKENLRTTKYADGTPIDQGNSTSTTVAYWYYPNNNSSNKATCGLLYNWKAVMRSSSSSSANPSGVQGICPIGWHVPSDAEWTQLTDYVSSQSQYQCNSNSSNIAKALASTTTAWATSTNTCAVGNTPSTNNSTGFGALPAGHYSGSGISNLFGDYAFFWSATEGNRDYAYRRNLYYVYAYVYRDGTSKYAGFSVRCLRNN